ncbi:Metal homeostasis factor ATX1 [Verticillium dahliae VDG1]|nr:Metal homeostasis factor ATX1 [Verticillium dahliae VDG1]
MTDTVESSGGPGDDEIKPYRIHVSSKYLDLTKRKLELTRLPHEVPKPTSADWWEPKPQVEPLIDFWMEQYSWRQKEEELNEKLPQFRINISVPDAEAPVRIHFIHVRSSRPAAVPLLLLPPFPFTNLSLGHLVKLFTEPEDVDNGQPFHLADFAALSRRAARSPSLRGPDAGATTNVKKGATTTPSQFGLHKVGVLEPNTLAYALCDSPVGLLVFALKSLRTLGPRTDFTPADIVTLAMLAWLPGPEAALRFWAHCVGRHAEARSEHTRPRVAITVFLGDEEEAGASEGDVEMANLPRPAASVYSCPGWANSGYAVVHTNRAPGEPGLLAWERPEIIVSGVTGLAKRILAQDARLRPAKEPETVPLDGVAVVQEVTAPAAARADEETGSRTTAPESKIAGTIPLSQLLQPPGPTQGIPGTSRRSSDLKDGGLDLDSATSPDTLVVTPPEAFAKAVTPDEKENKDVTPL